MGSRSDVDNENENEHSNKASEIRNEDEGLASKRSEEPLAIESVKTETNDEEEKRDQFSSQCEYLMSAIGFAVGLGNIWRFPAKAYQHGGGAFLIPYFCCTFFFAVPIFYLETAVAQYVQKGPMVLFYKYMPASQGIGWSMIFLNMQVYAYYMVIVGWTILYLVYIIIGKSSSWTRCDNEWNSVMCFSQFNNLECTEKNASLAIFFNGTCYEADPRKLINGTEARVAAEEFFVNKVLMRTNGIDDFGGMNWPVFGTMAFLWILCGFIVWKGLAVMGKVSYITTSLPYLIVGILFVRGITLDGARKGLDYYILNPNFSKIGNLETWKDAIFQVCFSTSVGLGAIHSMGSFTKKTHNTFRDAYLVVIMDTIMSIVGGTAVFSVLGHMSTHTGIPISKLVESEFSIAFIAYPEAMALMPVPALWAFLFFLMLFVLGLSTQLVDAQAFSTCVVDVVPRLRPYITSVRWIVCIVFFFLGILTYTKAGIYWLTLLDNALASIALFLTICIEFILFGWLYGCSNVLKDIRSVFGKPTNFFGKLFGKSGLYFYLHWKFLGPILAAILAYESFAPLDLKLGDYVFPPWTTVFGYIYGNISLIFIPGFFIVNMLQAKTFKSAFQVHPSHPSYNRIMGIDEPSSTHDEEEQSRKEETE